MDPRPPATRHPPLLLTGVVCLGLSFLVTALSAELGAPPPVAWAESAAFWVGMICVAGHVLRLALVAALAPAPSEPSPGEASSSWGETERWQPPAGQ